MSLGSRLAGLMRGRLMMACDILWLRILSSCMREMGLLRRSCLTLARVKAEYASLIRSQHVLIEELYRKNSVGSWTWLWLLIHVVVISSRYLSKMENGRA